MYIQFNSALITLIEEETEGDLVQFMNPIIEKLGQAFNIYQVCHE